MKFSYEARTPNGDVQTGTVEAASFEGALEILQRYDLIVVDIKEEKEGVSLSTEIKFLTRIKKQDIVLFSRQLAVLFDAQVPLLESLRTLANQSINPKLRGVINEVADDIDAGTSFSDALEKHSKHFSNFYVNVVRAGEASGRLHEVLNYLADHEEKNYDLTRKVKGALIYPAFIVFSIIAVGFVMMMFVVPKITSIFEETNSELPFLTKIVISTSGFLQSFWWLILIALVGLGFLLWRYVKTTEGRRSWDKFLLNIPVLKDLFRKMYLARFTENLSTLIKGGIPIIQALSITAEVVGNKVYQETISEATEEVRKGGDISNVLKTNKYIPSLVVQMISVGEGTGKLDVILSKIASFYQKDVDNMVNNLTSIIQPILIVVLGVAAGLLVAAVLLPIYNLSSSF